MQELETHLACCDRDRRFRGLSRKSECIRSFPQNWMHPRIRWPFQGDLAAHSLGRESPESAIATTSKAALDELVQGRVLACMQCRSRYSGLVALCTDAQLGMRVCSTSGANDSLPVEPSLARSDAALSVRMHPVNVIIRNASVHPILPLCCALPTILSGSPATALLPTAMPFAIYICKMHDHCSHRLPFRLPFRPAHYNSILERRHALCKRAAASSRCCAYTPYTSSCSATGMSAASGDRAVPIRKPCVCKNTRMPNRTAACLTHRLETRA